MAKINTGDMAILRNLIASRTSVAEAEPELAPCGGTYECYEAHDYLDDYVRIHEEGWSIEQVRVNQELEALAEQIKSHTGTPPTQEQPVTKLPEVHDPAGDSLPFHVASGKATQVLGSVAIDPSRMPDADDPTLTERERDAGVAEITKLIQASKLGKLAHKWDASIHVTVRVSR
jgi:hypothetical protein